MAIIALRALAANWTTSDCGCVCRLCALFVGCGIYDPNHAARRRDAGRARLQLAALRSQCAGERAVFYAVGCGGFTIGDLENLERAPRMHGKAESVECS